MIIKDVKDNIVSIEKVFNKSECNEIIKYYDNENVLKQRTGKENWRTSEFSSLFTGGWDSIWKELIHPRLRKVAKEFDNHVSFGKYPLGYACKEAVFLRYLPGDKCNPHTDGISIKTDDKGITWASMANCIIYLTKGAGGGDGALKFPEHNCYIEAVPGNAVMYPTSYTHPHEVEPVTKRRDVLACWFYAKAG
jgi:predicted 2-oxoglutarate/Fe(II)-dependent dioxygenase YbiX